MSNAFHIGKVTRKRGTSFFVKKEQDEDFSFCKLLPFPYLHFNPDIASLLFFTPLTPAKQERYIKTFESFVSEKKEFYIEVSVRDARKALDHLEDMHRRRYETDGSNYYLFKDEDEAYDALQHFKGMGLEVEDHNVNEATFAEEDEIATYDDPSGEDGLTHIMKRKGGYYGYNDNFDFYAKDKKELKGKLNSWGYKQITGKI
jgi:hypothetical protein